MNPTRKQSMKDVLKKTVAALLPQAADTTADLRKAEAEKIVSLSAIRQEIGRLEARRAAFLADFETVKLPQAKERADQAEADIAAAQAKLPAIEGELEDVRRLLADVEAAREREAALQRVRGIARLRDEYARAAQNVQQSAEDLAAGLHHIAHLGEEMSAHLKGIILPAERALFLRENIDARARQSLWPFFAHEPPSPGRPFDPNQWRWMSWDFNRFRRLDRSFVEQERAMLDQLVGFFATRKEAEKVRQRIDPTGERVHVVRDDEAKVFRLVDYQLAGDYGADPAVEGEAVPRDTEPTPPDAPDNAGNDAR